MAFLFTNILHSKGFRRYVAANVSFGDLPPTSNREAIQAATFRLQVSGALGD